MSEYILYCPNPVCKNIVSRNINYSVQPGTIVQEMKCGKCGELIEIVVELKTQRKGVLINIKAKLPKD